MSNNNLWKETLNSMFSELKSSNFFNFLKRNKEKGIIFEDENILEGNLNKQLNPKFMYNSSQKKSMIYQIALILLVADNSTTNLDIKNALHNVFPGIDLKQSEVSVIMAELTKEKNDWTVKNNGKHNEYQFNQTTSAAHIDIPAVIATPTTVVKVNTTIPDTTNLVGIVKTDGKTVSLGKLGSHSADFLRKLDPSVKVAFAKGFAPCLTNTLDKFEARKLFKTVTGAKHNDVRIISIKTYMKRFNIK